MNALSPEYLTGVFLVFVRVGSLLLAAPYFGYPAVPMRLRVMFAIVLAFVMSGLVDMPSNSNAANPFWLVPAIAVEAATGLIIGFGANFIFWVVQYASEIMGFQMGLAMAQMFNPLQGVNSNPIGRITNMALLMAFILLDGPHHLIRALAISFDAVPLGGAHVGLAGQQVLVWGTDLFEGAVRLAAPIMTTFFLVEAALGIFARVVPQADLFSLGLPLKLLTGLSIIWLFSEGFFAWIPINIDLMFDQIDVMINLLRPS